MDWGGWQIIEIGIGVTRDLLSVGVNRLRKITLPIQQTHCHKWQTHIARGFAMIAGQDTETAGVNRETFVKTELKTKIRHEIAFFQLLVIRCAHRLAMVSVVGGKHAIVGRQEHLIVDRIHQTLFIDTP